MKNFPCVAAFCAALAAPHGAALADAAHSGSTGSAGLSVVLGGVMAVEAVSLASVPERRIQRIAASYAPPGSGGDPRITDAGQLSAMEPPRGEGEWRCLTEALYFEARGEEAVGQYAVAEVILNRVDHAGYPDTVCGVVNQGTGRRHACQFAYTCDGRLEIIHDTAAWNRLGHVARIMLDGAPRDLTHGATHYHATSVTPRWARRYPRTAQYGKHFFYRQQY